MRTMRDIYEHQERRHSSDVPERKDRARRALAMRFGGVALHDHVGALRSALPGESWLDKPLGERNALAQALTGCNLDRDVAEVDQLAPPLPDFRLRLRSGDRVYAELARVAGSNRYQMYGYLERIRRTIAAERVNDPLVAAAVRAARFEFVFEGLPFRTSDQDWLAGEILEVVRGSVAQKPPVGRWLEPNGTLLRTCGGRYKVSAPDAHEDSIGVMMSLFPFPHDVVDAILERIEDKRRHVPGYGVLGAQLWLVLCLWDPFSPDNWSFGPIRRRISEIDIEPFDRLVIGCMDGGFVLERDPTVDVRHVRLFSEEQIPRTGDVFAI